MQQQQCLFCGHSVQMVQVHGHYQCPVCKINTLPCCDGDNCETNYLLKQKSTESAVATEPQALPDLKNPFVILRKG